MDCLKLFCTATGSFIVLFLLTRLNGKRQVSQLSAFDYINSISIGSIAAEMATELEEFWKPLTAMVIYALLVVLFNILCDKSLKFRHLVIGTPQILLEDGVFYRESFKSGRIDLDEFLSRCRMAGYFKVTDIQMAVLEPSGQITFLPYEGSRPATPTDLGKAPAAAPPPVPLISDGKILREKLKTVGMTETELLQKLQAEKVESPTEVFLATCDEKGALRIYTMQEKKPQKKL